VKLTKFWAGAGMLLAMTAAPLGEELLTAADTSEILNIAQSFGSANLLTQSNGDPQISGKINGIAYQVYFRNCSSNEGCEDLNFYLGFLDIKPGLEVINTWNDNMRFSRAYLDEDEDACVEMDVDLAPGVTEEYLRAQFGIWERVLNQYSEYVGYR
jgi:hypothetical protein